MIIDLKFDGEGAENIEAAPKMNLVLGTVWSPYRKALNALSLCSTNSLERYLFWNHSWNSSHDTSSTTMFKVAEVSSTIEEHSPLVEIPPSIHL